jgi:nucleotide-binding universal stress UspA family protein
MPAQLKQIFSSIFSRRLETSANPMRSSKDPNVPSPWLIHHVASRRPGALTGSGDGLTQDHLLTEMFDEQGSPGMYANILLSTDGSDVARKGLEHGIALAKALDAKVTVITVTEPLPIDFGGGHAGGWIPSPEEVDRYDAACKERAGKVLNEAQAMAEPIGISTELLHIPNAHPASAIVETAKSRDCDLIVMGSHGRRGLKKLFLGSQTSEVLADGSVPVLVVRA